MKLQYEIIFSSAFHPGGVIDDHQICILEALPKTMILFDCTLKAVGTVLVAFDAPNVSNAACFQYAPLERLYCCSATVD
jgi:hypothetical protein